MGNISYSTSSIHISLKFWKTGNNLEVYGRERQRKKEMEKRERERDAL
jgi:hypothetical protein